MIKVIPAILTNSFDEFEKVIRLIEPHSSRVHLDIADGVFVPNETIKGYMELPLISTDLKFDVHLMVKSPLYLLSYWADISQADRFIVHVESEDTINVLKELKFRNKQIGLALNPDTSISSIEPFLSLINFVQFMTINPGFQGRDFLDYVIEKIENFHKEYPEIIIAVDGGINPTTARNAVLAGACVLVSGSFIFKSGNIGKAIEKLKKISEN